MLPFKPIQAASGLMRQVRITSITPETDDARTFSLEPLDGSLPYRAGQFLTFVFQLQNRQERRSYSLSSSPEWNEKAAVTVKRLANGAFSRPMLEKAEAGDILTIAGGASGFYTLPNREEITNYKQFVF